MDPLEGSLMISSLVLRAPILSAPTAFTQEPGASGFSSFQERLHRYNWKFHWDAKEKCFRPA